MAHPKRDPAAEEAYREELRRIGRKVNARLGIPEDMEANPVALKEAMLARGVRPEDRIGTRELMRMRYGEDWEEE